MAVSIGAALAVLVVLVLRTQGEPQALEGHLARMSAIADLRLADDEASAAVKRARLRLDAEVDGFADASARLKAAGDGLSRHQAALQSVSRDLGGSVGLLHGHVQDKASLLVAYAAQLEQFGSAYTQLRSRVETLLADPAFPREHVLNRTVRGLIEEVTVYSLLSAPTNQDRIDSLRTTLSAESGAVPSLRSRLLALDTAVSTALAQRDLVSATATRIADIPIATQLDRLQSRYVSHYQQSEHEVARYRLVLAVYAGALLVVFGFVGWRLRRSHAELQDLNTNLEATVEARTGELRKALDDLKLQQAQLIQSEKMAALGQMVAGVAHEINTPLGYVRGNVETVRDSLPLIRELLDAAESGDAQRRDEAWRRWPPGEGLAELDMLLTDAGYGIGQISELVMSLKDFSRVDRSLTERFDLNEGLDTALKICQNQFKHRVRIEREYGDLPPVPCAPSQINQVFLNLINNAGQAIDGEGTITLRSRIDGDDAIVEVADTGCGMDAATIAHIFEPFFTTKAVGQGTGLGLSIVFRIVEDHRGRIEVDSTPGKGTTFRVRLPLGRAPAAPPVVEEVAQEIPA